MSSVVYLHRIQTAPIEIAIKNKGHSIGELANLSIYNIYSDLALSFSPNYSGITQKDRCLKSRNHLIQGFKTPSPTFSNV